MKRIICILLSLVLLLSMTACGAGQEQPSTPTEANTEQLQLVKGESMTLSCPFSAQSWESSDSERAAVDEKGTVTALADCGSVTVTATAGDQTESWQIALCRQTEYGAVSLPSSAEKLTIGVWSGSYHAFDDFRMEMMQQAGISLIVGIDPQWVVETSMTELLDIAQSYGVSLITDLRSWDQETVPEYAQHPALAGFLMYDEPGAPAFEELKQLKEKFDAVMPEDTVFYVNLFGCDCGYESLYGNDYDPLRVNYEKYYLNLFADTVKPEMMSFDAYGLQEGGYIRLGYLKNFDMLSNRAKKDGVPLWYTLLSSAHNTTDGRYITPTDESMRWEMALAMTYGAQVLLHYTLTSHDTDDYVCMLEYGSFTPTDIYDDVMQVNQEFLAWQDIYMSYDWMGTVKVDVGDENLLLEELAYDISLKETGVLTGVESDHDLLVGAFQKDGKNAYMVTNICDTTDSDLWRRLHYTVADAQVKLQLAAGDYSCAAVICKGELSFVPVSQDNTVSITVDAFDGVFVIPVTK